MDKGINPFLNPAQHPGASAGLPIPLPIELPPHLFYPEDAITLDMATVANLNAGETATLINFQCPDGMTAFFTAYAIFNNGLLAANYAFLPAINGNRIYPYHGDPLSVSNAALGGYKLYLGLGADLSDVNLRQAYAVMNPGQTLTWTATNNSSQITAMGVRVVGYLSQGQARQIARFGG